MEHCALYFGVFVGRHIVLTSGPVAPIPADPIPLQLLIRKIIEFLLLEGAARWRVLVYVVVLLDAIPLAIFETPLDGLSAAILLLEILQFSLEAVHVNNPSSPNLRTAHMRHGLIVAGSASLDIAGGVLQLAAVVLPLALPTYALLGRPNTGLGV